MPYHQSPRELFPCRKNTLVSAVYVGPATDYGGELLLEFGMTGELDKNKAALSSHYQVHFHGCSTTWLIPKDRMWIPRDDPYARNVTRQ